MKTALPVLEPATVTSPVREPWATALATTRVTIGPGMMIRMVTATTNAAKR
jgi:hypothetical protein